MNSVINNRPVIRILPTILMLTALWNCEASYAQTQKNTGATQSTQATQATQEGPDLVTVHSLSAVPAQIKSRRGRAVYDEEMSGKPLPDSFGTHLPDGLTQQAIVEVMKGVNAIDASAVTLVGAKAWPYEKDVYIVIACLAEGPNEAAAALHDSQGKPSCEGSDDHPPAVYLAMIDYKGAVLFPDW